MQVQYLEIVTADVDAVCASYTKIYGVEFSDGDAGLGGARTAKLANGGMIGVRGTLSEMEKIVVRPYLLVDDIDMAVEMAVDSGGMVAMPPTEIPGHGKFALYFLGDNEFGLWQL